MHRIVRYCQSVIEYSFYLIFILVPLFFWGSTSELFELNKMWLTYGLTLVIFAAWLTEMVFEKRIKISRTILDIPLIFFLISQTLSTLYSIEPYVSFWGYYSRFNGGLLSIFCYVILYYALVSHFDSVKVKRLLKVMLFSGALVSLWGLPSHFGYDPTCYIFRGHLDVSCWKEAFQPTVRIFSTLGQPAWLAAFLTALLPITLSLFFLKLVQKEQKGFLPIVYYLILNFMFYLCLLFTNTRAGFLGFWIVNTVFWLLLLLRKILPVKSALIMLAVFNFQFLLLNFFFGTPIDQLNKFSLPSLRTPKNLTTQNNATAGPQTGTKSPDINITDSGNIRLYVWQGAYDIWKNNPWIGTGVETFAFAYYKHKPVGHNLTSEWDYLYNKAHNEYLNYLATTGIVGLGSYLTVITVFLMYAMAKIANLNFAKSDKPHIFPLQLDKTHDQDQADTKQKTILTLGLFSSYASILITNFFGFSVVIMNLLLFLIPGLVFLLYRTPQHTDNQSDKQNKHISVSQWFIFSLITLAVLYLLLTLYQYWKADVNYNKGTSLGNSGYSREAYNYLAEATQLRPSEPVYRDELSLLALQLSLDLFQQKEATLAATLAQQAVELNEDILIKHPGYLPFWKTRIRLFYTLGELEPDYKQIALQAAEHAASAAPTDAKIWYNLGILYGQTGKEEQGIKTLQKTIKMKPDYQDAYLALGLLYRQTAIDKENKIIKPDQQRRAKEALQKLLQINPGYEEARKTLDEWK